MGLPIYSYLPGVGENYKGISRVIGMGNCVISTWDSVFGAFKQDEATRAEKMKSSFKKTVAFVAMIAWAILGLTLMQPVNGYSNTSGYKLKTFLVKGLT